MIKCKIKNEEFYDAEFEVEITDGSNIIYLNNINNYHNLYIDNMFYHIGNNLYMEDDSKNKFSLINIKHWSENKKICIECQCLYIGKKFISDINNISKISIFFGDNFINECDNRIKEIMKNKISFKVDGVDILIENTKLSMNGNLLAVVSENQLFHNIYELLWLIYGFFPKIKEVEYLSDTGDVITEYITTLYIYNSSMEHFLRMNTLIDINKISSFPDLIENWKSTKNKIGDNAYRGLLLSQSKYNPHIDMQLCNLLQSLDGLTENIFKDVFHNIVKVQMIEYLRAFLDIYNESNKPAVKELKSNLKGALYDLKKYSFKERLNMLIENCNYQQIFSVENKITQYFGKEKNECKIFLKYNPLLRKCVDHRNYLSHMNNEEDLFDIMEIKLYYWKLLLLYRLILIEKLGMSDAIIDENVERFIKQTLNWYIENKNECRNCKYYYSSKCSIINGGNKNE